MGEGLASRGLSFHVPELGLLVLGVCSIYAARSLSDPFNGFHPAPFQRRAHSGRIAELNRTLPVTGRPAVPNRARFAKNMLRGGSPKDSGNGKAGQETMSKHIGGPAPFGLRSSL